MPAGGFEDFRNTEFRAKNIPFSKTLFELYAALTRKDFLSR